VVAVCDANDKEILEMVDEAMPIQGQLKEEFTPLAYVVPGQLFAFSTLHVRGQPPIPPPLDFQKLMEVNFKQIYQSNVWEE
jgi:hypothetical protein